MGKIPHTPEESVAEFFGVLELAPALRKLIPAYAGTALHKNPKDASPFLNHYSVKQVQVMISDLFFLTNCLMDSRFRGNDNHVTPTKLVPGESGERESTHITNRKV